MQGTENLRASRLFFLKFEVVCDCRAVLFFYPPRLLKTANKSAIGNSLCKEEKNWSAQSQVLCSSVREKNHQSYIINHHRLPTPVRLVLNSKKTAGHQENAQNEKQLRKGSTTSEPVYREVCVRSTFLCLVFLF